MKGIKTILIPTDFSKNARSAVEYALQNFNGEDVCFWFLYVSRVKYSGATVSKDVDDLLREESEASMKDELELFRQKHPKSIIKGLAYQGALVDIVTKIVNKEQIDLIVMGTQGASGVKEVVLGSNAANIMKHSTKPLVLVPANHTTEQFKTILFATDLKFIKGYETIQPLHRIAKESGAKLEILHLSKEKGTTDEHAKEELRLDTVFSDIPHQFHFQDQTIPEDDILDYSHKVSADLIVVVSRSHNFFSRLLHRSVSRKLSMHSDIPVLILKEN